MASAHAGKYRQEWFEYLAFLGVDEARLRYPHQFYALHATPESGMKSLPPRDLLPQDRVLAHRRENPGRPPVEKRGRPPRERLKVA